MTEHEAEPGPRVRRVSSEPRPTVALLSPDWTRWSKPESQHEPCRGSVDLHVSFDEGSTQLVDLCQPIRDDRGRLASDGGHASTWRDNRLDRCHCRLVHRLSNLTSKPDVDLANATYALVDLLGELKAEHVVQLADVADWILSC